MIHTILFHFESVAFSLLSKTISAILTARRTELNLGFYSYAREQNLLASLLLNIEIRKSFKNIFIWNLYLKSIDDISNCTLFLQ